MKFFLLTTLLAAMSSGCGVPATLALREAFPIRFTLLTGEQALEAATIRVMLVDRTHPANLYRVQTLPSIWESAIVRLHAKAAPLTQDRTVAINRSGGFSGNTTQGAAFTMLRPGDYLFQVTLMSGADGTGESTAVHTTELMLKGGSNTSITVSMKTTDGADSSSGGTVLNSAVSDTLGYVHCNSTNYNSVLCSNPSLPVIVAGDTLAVDPLLSDSTATGSASVAAGGSTVCPIADLDPGVLSRVVLSYASASVIPTGSVLVPGEVFLTDWVRNGNDPVRQQSWAAIADDTDGASWPARGGAVRTGSGTFNGAFTWNTTISQFPLAFADESALSENYRLVFRYYDNTTSHRLIRIRTLPLAVVSPASIGFTVQ
jgi:hypothetical protein